jgi:hypothetical protein
VSVLGIPSVAMALMVIGRPLTCCSGVREAMAF